MKLNEKYQTEPFINFIQDFLPEDLTLREEDIVINKDRYKEIKKAKILGFCDSLELHILEMEHSRDKDPRVSIATDAFKILADHWIHRALVVFKNNDTENYRLSYLTISLDLNEKNKVVKTYSNARRYSFYLGTQAKVKTPEQQLIKKGRVKDADDLLSRFSVEVVNKQFYLEVAKFFDELVSVEAKNLILPGGAEFDANIRKSFAVRLIGRAMFCWFLKQKKSDSGQLIPDEILSSKVIVDNYYHNTLEPLFFGVLNTSIEARDIRTELFDKVPYLNGGLFNPQVDDFYELDRGTFASKFINTLRISDKWFKEFFELLETYNFTIDENTVFDQELSVDPEMLGRIFENLLAEINPETGSSERKRTGSFYTPRQIVEYMVDQSLIEYFKTKTDIEEKKLQALVSYDLVDDASYPLEQEQKIQIINAIESLKILDPACGSGAYPIGALQKIVYILQQLDPDCTLWLEKKLQGVPDLYKQKIINEVKQNPFDYTRKLDVIKNSIFGVDIQPIAVDVSRLRCFLTLVVESEIDDSKPNRGIEPLPNLDFKFVCANTLISLPKSENTGLFDDHSGILELSKIMSEYFSCNSQRKNELKIKFTNTQKEILEKTISAFGRNTGELTLKLTTWNPFSNQSSSWFDPEWMYGLQDKFNIVLGNPPYVEVEKDKYWVENYSEVLKGHYDLYIFFFKKGTELLSGDGVICYITPHTFLSYSQFTNLRKYILDNLKIIECTSKVSSVFESAVVDNSIFLAKKSGGNILSRFTKKIIDGNLKDVDVLEIKSELLNSDSFEYELLKAKLDLNIIKSKCVPLGEITESSQGITVYAKVQGKKINYFSSEAQSANSKKVTRGKEINRYSLNWAGDYIEYGEWLWCRRNPKFFEGQKIFLRQTSDKIIATLVEEPFYCIDSVHSIIQKDKSYSLKFILGILNSKVIDYIYKRLTAESGKVFAQVKLTKLRTLPIPEVDTNNIHLVVQIENLVDKMLSNSEESCNSEIDELVMDLYGLDNKDRETIRTY